ncbi:MAG: TIGR01906 family membrane protein [Eubacteriales bacterium]|nr:TIGR01906 family membrane protein [Eubacteriales bacterium]
MFSRKALTSLSKILASLSLMVLLWGTAISLTSLQTWTYQAYLPALAAQDPQDLGEDRILENYCRMINYGLNPGQVGQLEFQSLPMSPQGRQHFAEVRAVFQAILKLTLASLPLCLLTLTYLHQMKIHSPLLWGPLGALLIPALLALLMLVDFSRAFTLFHQLVFRNDYWIFDPTQDPIINYLPQEFFQTMAFLILLVLLLLCLLSIALYQLLKSKGDKQKRTEEKK